MATEAEQAELERGYAKVPLQRLILPGRFNYYFRCTYGTWTLPGTTLEAFVEALQAVSGNGFKQLEGHVKAPYFRVSPTKKDGKGRNLIEINFLTPGTMFLDCAWLTVVSSGPDLQIRFYNQSSGIWPLAWPMPTLMGCVLCWFLWGDKKAFTQRTMEWLKDSVDIVLGRESTLVCNRYIPPFKPRLTRVRKA
jgi:hypothetical protein